MLLAKRFAAVWRGRVFGLNGKEKGALVWEGPGPLVVHGNSTQGNTRFTLAMCRAHR